MSGPFISVVVIANTRKNYILEALESVNNQSLNRNEYEVICVKNFNNEEIDNKINCIADVVINTENQDYGPKAAAAIKIAKGEVLCFLDDDDLFGSKKLEYVFEHFKQNKRLYYYHNGRTTDYLKFNNYLPNFKENTKCNVVDMQYDPYKKLIKFFKEYPDFNSSSISIRKVVLEDQLDSLNKMIMHPDTFFLFSALEKRGILIDDSILLTYYRVHQSTTNDFNSSPKEFFKNKFEYYSKTELDWKVIQTFLTIHINIYLCKCEELHNILLKELINPHINKHYLFSINFNFIRCLNSRKFRNLFVLLIVSFISSFFPQLGKKIYYTLNSKLLKNN